MSINDQYKKIRIFLASPSDVSKERECLHKVVSQLNQTGNIADKSCVILEVLDWSRHIKPSMGPPEGVILDQLPIGTWDMFIGILWLRFGSKTSDEFNSGTEEEFNLAYNSWKKTGKPNILFYRCNRAYNPMDTNSIQLQQVNNFFNKFNYRGKNPGFYKIYNNIYEFENIVTHDLIYYLNKIKDEQKKQTSEIIEEINLKEKTEPGKTFLDAFKIGDTYEVALIKLDMVDHSKILKKYEKENANRLFDNFNNFISSIIKKNRGIEFSWAGDGGLYLFYGLKAHTQLILSGIEVLNNLHIFNLDSEKNPLDEEIKIRLAAHSGIIEYKKPHSSIHAECINLVSHIEKKAAIPNFFYITDFLYKKLSERLQNIFKYDKKFENYSLFVYRPKTIKLDLQTLENFKNEIKEICFSLNKKILNEKNLSNTRNSYYCIQELIEKLYIKLDDFYFQFSGFDQSWSIKEIKLIIDCVNIVLAEEEKVFQQIQTFFNLMESKLLSHELRGLVQSAGVLRANSIPNLKKLISQFKYLMDDDEIYYDVPKEYLYEKILNFVDADEFNEENSLKELLVSEKERLISYISEEIYNPMYDKLVICLWRLADFVLLDDLSFFKFQKMDKTCSLFISLAENKYNGFLFSLVIKFFQETEDFNLKLISNYLDSKKISFKEEDLNIIYKCLLICEKKRDNRKEIIQSIDFNQLWRLILNSQTPFHIIQEIAENLYHKKDNDLMKIFFDLTFPRLIYEITDSSTEITLHYVKIILVIFYNFDFFVETNYFERLEDLRLRFISKAKKYKRINVNIIDEFLKRLQSKRDKYGKLPATIPKGVEKLPLAVQRHLAREGHYIQYFIKHRHYLIALEVRRYININNIDRTVKYLNLINPHLLKIILEKTELYRKVSTILLVLNSSKCTKQFAIKHIHKIPKYQLIQTAKNPNANPEVRMYIKNLIKNKYKLKI